MIHDKAVERWDRLLNQVYKDEVVNDLAPAYPDRRSLHVEFPDIERFEADLADALIESPDTVLPHANEALRNMDLPVPKRLDSAHVRVVKLPIHTPIRELRSHHIGKLIAVEGLVRKATEVRPKLVVAAFECQRCGHISYVEQDTGRFNEPIVCENEQCGRKGPFNLKRDESVFVDAQRIRIQESPEGLRGGEQPQTLDVTIEDDLCGTVTPGNRVVMSGILRSYQRESRSGKSAYFDIVLEGLSVEVEEQEFEDMQITPEDEEEILRLSRDPNIYDRVVKSIAPSIYGYEDVKEALALQLFGGVVKNLPDGSRIRGDMHVLLVGDPGIAKSQLLRYVVKLAPRGIYTSGKSATSAGLTATAVKDEFGDGRWTLEAGALVLADMGVAAVDEMDKMKADDRSALHEAMEQQTISVAKAGIMATLKSRCALLGAANPKYGRFNEYDSVAEQINMPPALMSRFDLIFVLTDKPNEDMDTKIANHILQSHYAGELNAVRENIPGSGITRDQVDAEMQTIHPDIEPELLRKYIAYARRRVFPVLTGEARERLEQFYVGFRKQGEDADSAVPVTARQLEALVRLAEASARIRLSDEITVVDAERVIRIVEDCLRQVGFDEEAGVFDVDKIAVGTTKSQRDRIKLLRDIIRDLASEHGGMAPEDEVLAEAEDRGIDRSKAEEIIKRLKQQGDVYSPNPGYYRLT